jgi:hypothetical protein
MCLIEKANNGSGLLSLKAAASDIKMKTIKWKFLGGNYFNVKKQQKGFFRGGKYF